MKTDAIRAAQHKTRKWRRDEYYQMAELGWFQDQRVELIGGVIVEAPVQKHAGFQTTEFPFGHRYADLTLHQRGDAVAPLARPEARVAVADLYREGDSQNPPRRRSAVSKTRRGEAGQVGARGGRSLIVR